MLNYILRRIALMIPTLIGMTLMLFCVVRFSPGVASGSSFDAGGGMTSDQARAEQVKRLQMRLRMVDEQGNKISLPMQYVLWLSDTARGNLGESLQYRKPVMDLVKERLPITLSLNIMATILVYLIAIPGGMLAAVRRGKMMDVSWSFITLALYSIPTMWVGSMAIGFFANPQHMGWFPSAGLHSVDTSRMTSLEYATDYLTHLILPVMVMTYGGFAYLSKQMRASMLDNLYSDYARTARAKGLSEFTVTTRHVLRNSLLPLITIATSIIPGLLGGSVIIEQIFSIKGMGELSYQATLARDLPLIQGLGVISAVLVLISYLATDICYAMADPRISYD